MYWARFFAVRHAGAFEWFYTGFDALLVALDPMFRRIGYYRRELPVAAVERVAKGLLLWSMRAVVHGHVLPHELPEEPAERSVRRCSPRRVL